MATTSSLGWTRTRRTSPRAPGVTPRGEPRARSQSTTRPQTAPSALRAWLRVGGHVWSTQAKLPGLPKSARHLLHTTNDELDRATPGALRGATQTIRQLNVSNARLEDRVAEMDAEATVTRARLDGLEALFEATACDKLTHADLDVPTNLVLQKSELAPDVVAGRYGALRRAGYRSLQALSADPGTAKGNPDKPQFVLTARQRLAQGRHDANEQRAVAKAKKTQRSVAQISTLINATRVKGFHQGGVCRGASLADRRICESLEELLKEKMDNHRDTVTADLPCCLPKPDPNSTRGTSSSWQPETRRPPR